MESQKEIIEWGFEDFKKSQPYPHVDKASYEAGATYAFDFANQEFKHVILEHFGYDDPLYTDVVEQLIDRFEERLGYEKTKQT